MTTATASAEEPTPRPQRRFQKAWSSVFQASVKATRYATAKVYELRGWLASKGNAGRDRAVRASQETGRVGKAVARWISAVTGAIVVGALSFIVDVVLAALLLAVAAFVALGGALALIGASALKQVRVVSTAVTTGGFEYLAEEQPDTVASELAEEPQKVRAPNADELLRTRMDEILDRNKELTILVGSKPDDDELVGRQAFIEFLMTNPWAMYPAQENKAWSSVARTHRRNGKRAATLRTGFRSERDTWAREFGLITGRAA